MGDENGHGGTPVSIRYGFVVDERAGPRSGPGVCAGSANRPSTQVCHGAVVRCGRPALGWRVRAHCSAAALGNNGPCVVSMTGTGNPAVPAS